MRAMQVLGVHHLAIKAEDVSRVAAFYRDVLGLPEQTRHHDGRGLRSIWLTAGEAILMIERSGTPGGARAAFEEDPAGLHLLALRIPAEAREAWRERLAAAGAPVRKETQHTLYTADPEGNRVGLSSWPGSTPDRKPDELPRGERA